MGERQAQGGTSYWFHDLAEAAKSSLEWAKKFDVYFGIGLAPSKPKGRNADRIRVKADEVAAIPGLWVEVDYQSSAEAHRKKNLPPTKADALALIGELPFKPTIVVHNGNGLHAYWLFTELWQLETTEARETAKSTVEKWQRLLKEKAEAHGWANDSTFDLARMYRVADTKNRKDPEHPKPVEIIELNESVFQQSELVEYVSKLTVSDHRTKQMSEIKSRVATMGELKLEANAEYPPTKFEMLCHTFCQPCRSH